MAARTLTNGVRQKSANGPGSRVLNKLRICLEARQFYEAHQLYRTLYFRLIAQEKYQQVSSVNVVIVLKNNNPCSIFG